MAPQGNSQGTFSPNSRNKDLAMNLAGNIAAEVRILLADIGKLRDERRQLQYEIAELMAVRSKFSANGEFQPEWRPPAIEAPPPPEPPLAIEAPPQAKPGWRVVHKKPERKARTTPKMVGPPPPATPAPEAPKPQVPAWAQWRPNPLLAPTPVAPGSPGPPPRAGLFGPSTPPPK
ncbi:hypothetical protein JR316_0012911 [Psilocybe cubensis]|uniref:Uncharacterized protein n=2 Tax=Psilocybe cubensis TaxID=181762 RepID=A0A8H7XTK8_PSICU|nr:hypothetical protein JR316_0012911 [Psilocybe cubensis]KAH9474452.1 hypothetical protein JR316_0012911 [Psilocybe cubensis]